MKKADALIGDKAYLKPLSSTPVFLANTLLNLLEFVNDCY